MLSVAFWTLGVFVVGWVLEVVLALLAAQHIEYTSVGTLARAPLFLGCVDYLHLVQAVSPWSSFGTFV